MVRCERDWIQKFTEPTPTPIEIGSLREKGPAIEETRGLLRRLETICSSVVESTRFLTPRVPLMVESSMISILNYVYALAHCVAHKIADKTEENKPKKEKNEGRWWWRRQGIRISDQAC